MGYTFSDSGSEDSEVVYANSGFLDKYSQEVLDSAVGNDSRRLRPRQYGGQTLDVSKIFTGQNGWQVNTARRPSVKLRQRVARLQSLLAARLLVDPLVAVFNTPSSAYSDDRNYFCEACAVCMPAREQEWQTHTTGLSHQCQMLSLSETGELGHMPAGEADIKHASALFNESMLTITSSLLLQPVASHQM